MKWYKFSINDFTDEEFLNWYSLMSEEKRNRVDKFRYIEDKKRTVAGEMLARKAIAEYCNVKPEDVAFYLNEKGKPYPIDLDIEFNVSHCGDFVVCAISNSPVGIDIENVRPIDLKVAKRMFSKEELFYLFGKTPSQCDFIYTYEETLLKRFYTLWTKKEATAKCTGVGLFSEENTEKFNITYIEEIENYIICICENKCEYK